MPSKKRPSFDDQTREDWRLRLALIKESAAFREFWAEQAETARNAYQDVNELNRALRDAKCPDEVAAAFERHKEAVDTLTAFNNRLHAFGLRGPYCEALDALDPRNEDIPAKLPVTFDEAPAIVQVETPGTPQEGRAGVPFQRIPEHLKPSERTLTIDLSRKREEIEAELKRYLDAVEDSRESEDAPDDWRANYEQWEPDRSRFRAEAWQALQVYRMRRKSIPYRAIKQAIGISVDAAKKAFRTAFEKIEARPYDDEGKEFFRREVQQAIRPSELQKACPTCPKRDIADGGDGTCKELCPDVMAYCRQDEVLLGRESCESWIIRDTLEEDRDKPPY